MPLNRLPACLKHAPRADSFLTRIVRSIVLILTALIGLIGCQSNPPTQSGSTDFFGTQEIYETLKKEAVPLPERTPYDDDPERRNAFLKGFRRGWDLAISGALLHGTFGNPHDLAERVVEAWSAGWQAGAKEGSDRWVKESRELGAKTSQTNDEGIDV